MKGEVKAKMRPERYAINVKRAGALGAAGRNDVRNQTAESIDGILDQFLGNIVVSYAGNTVPEMRVTPGQWVAPPARQPPKQRPSCIKRLARALQRTRTSVRSCTELARHSAA